MHSMDFFVVAIVGRRSLVGWYWSFDRLVIGHLVIGRSSLVGWSLVIDHLSLIAGSWSLVVLYFTPRRYVRQGRIKTRSLTGLHKRLACATIDFKSSLRALG